MKIRGSLILIVLFFAGVAAAGSSGSSGLSYLKIGIDGRAVGMGEAYSAAATDASAVYWNPAGLVAAKYSNVAVNHNEWIEGIRGEFAAISLAGGRSAWAFHVRSFNIGDIAVRSFPSENPLEKTSAHYLSAGISYARRIHSKIDFGVTAKYLFEKIYVETASGFAADFGLMVRDFLPNLKVAAVLQNVGHLNNFRDESTKLPLIARLGGYYTLPAKIQNLKINLAADLVKPGEDHVHLHLGGELLFFNQLALRGGYLNGYDARQFSFGAGVVRSSIRLDYALTPFDNNLGVAHRFSVNFVL